MKRKSRADIPSPAVPKRQSRQDPVSCESCRKKKLKCDRQLPCSSCSARGLACSYEPRVTMPIVKPRVQGTRPSQNNNEMSLPPQTNQDSASQIQAGNEPLITADWLENIVMSHRVPTALPPTLREEFSQQRHIDNRLQSQRRNGITSSLLAIIHSGHLASREKPSTIHLPSYLPPKTETISLFRYYCNFLDYLYHLIIPARVERSIENIYEKVSRNESIDLNHLALIFSIISTSTFFQLLTEASEYAEVCGQELAFLTGAALIQSNHIANPTVEGLQATMILGHHLPSMSSNPSVSGLFLHGSLVSQAKSLGLHLLDTPRAIQERGITGFDKVDVELKRRLWWDLVSYEWLLGFLSGPQEWTYTIHMHHMNVREPLNLDDDDLEQNDNGMPLCTPTSMSYTLQRLKLAVICRQIVDETAFEHFHGQDVPYDKILDLDRRIQQAYAEVPNFFRFDQSSRREFISFYRERPTIAYQRALLQQGYHSRLCRLHRHYFVRGSKDPRYSYSHVVCLQSARKVLEVKRIMDEEEPQFTPHSSVVWSVMHHVFMAAVILLIDVCFNWDDILAEKRKQEVLDACRTLNRAQKSSSIAKEGINAMMAILQRHWKLQKRPLAGAFQSEPSPIPVQTAPISKQQQATLSGSRKEVSDQPVQNDYSQPILGVGVGSEAISMHLEDIWSEMLEESAQVELDTPDWTDLLTELTNATLPCE
ncbi:transcriptional regulator family: Fungal Specific TF [Penicillium lagena]|uniref:transcriptional regulator family: Fungal Specific TF n=1 Tax=Penicillium lagena TaxID=94218 RepID=UPI0025412B13|nr:transcriptional regulator family: Fungal Specific TF [Penicillium lagena]KAJ5624774.1 transcriptional regulator family: Fungal Specific TF [Penicillium lagena]